MEIKKIFLSILCIAGGLMLAACGGESTDTGGGGGGEDLDASLTLSGLVYDAEIPDAAVSVYLGDTAVGTGTTDANGRYSVSFTYPAADTDKQLVVRAQRGSTALITLAGTVGTVAASATDGAVSGDALPDLNATNVSTAIYAIVKQHDGTNPATLSATELSARREAIRSDAAKQQLVLQLAAAVKAVVDYGAAVDRDATDGVEVSDTLALAEQIAAAAASDSAAVETILTDLATEIGVASTDLIAEVEADPNVAAQLVLPEIAGTDLVGKRFAVGEDTLVAMNADGVLALYDYGLETETGTWSFDEATQSLTLQLGAESYQLAFSGGSVDVALPAELTGTGTTAQQVTLYRALEVGSDIQLADIPVMAFDMANGALMVKPGACDGTSLGLYADASGPNQVACQVINGAIVSSNSGTLPASPEEGTYSVVVPLAGSTTSRLNFARWTSNGEDRTTEYSSAFAPVDKPLPDNGGVVRVDTVTGDVSISMADDDLTQITDADCITTTSQGCVRVYVLRSETDGGDITYLRRVWLTTDPTLGIDFVLSDANTVLTDGTTAAVYRLAGGTPGVLRQGVLTSVTVDNGDVAGGAITHTAQSTVKTQNLYPLTDFAVADVSGKAFTFEDEDGQAGSVSFDASGTLTLNGQNGTWIVEARDKFPYVALWMSTATGSNVMFKMAVDRGDGQLPVAGLYSEDGVFDDAHVLTFIEQ